MILITGGAGFIGSNFVSTILKYTNEDIIVVDCLTYASKLGYPHIKDLAIHFEKINIVDLEELEKIFKKYNIKYIFNFAAESHVDNSIKDCYSFLNTNIVGTVNLLNLAIKYKIEKFIQISTDEVFGSIPIGHFNEQSNINPRNPYSASKASAEHFVWSYINTYNFPAIIVNCSNNYGPNQYPEKLIPLAVTKLLHSEKVPVYGQGNQIRDWIYVEDCCEAIWQVFNKGKVFERYCIGGNCEISNLDLINKIIDIMKLPRDSFELVSDRLGHDFRYSTDITKINTEVGWFPVWDLDSGLTATIERIKLNENRI